MLEPGAKISTTLPKFENDERASVIAFIAPVRGQACNLQFATFKNIQEKTYWVRFARSGRAVVKRGGFLTLALIAFP
jgi:hypothetical protein